MHESGLSAALARQIRQVLLENNARHVIAIAIDLGEFTGMSAAHLSEHLQHELAGTQAGAARFVFALHDDPADPAAYSARLRSVEIET